MVDESIAQGGRIVPQVPSATDITHEPLKNISYSDTYEVTYHIVGWQHLV
jgi:hypothetical protein